jgi:hypothetical protein
MDNIPQGDTYAAAANVQIAIEALLKLLPSGEKKA